MADYCPFINRADKRCSAHFSIDALEQAFAHCFGDYLSCAHHAQLNDEQAMREGIEGEVEDHDGRIGHIKSPVQVTVSARRSRRLAAAA
jgi:hypothetical protein